MKRVFGMRIWQIASLLGLMLGVIEAASGDLGAIRTLITAFGTAGLFGGLGWLVGVLSEEFAPQGGNVLGASTAAGEPGMPSSSEGNESSGF